MIMLTTLSLLLNLEQFSPRNEASIRNCIERGAHSSAVSGVLFLFQSLQCLEVAVCFLNIHNLQKGLVLNIHILQKGFDVNVI